jgi:hypothetical protein
MAIKTIDPKTNKPKVRSSKVTAELEIILIVKIGGEKKGSSGFLKEQHY